MQETSVFWLRAAVALYGVGLFHTVQSAFRTSRPLFRPALISFAIAVVLHMVALVDSARTVRHFPPYGFHNAISLCAFLLAVLFLVVYAKYRLQSLGLFLFPLVFTLALIASILAPRGSWPDSSTRDTWLLIHVILVLLGYVLLLLTALASLAYILQERQLKRKKSIALLEKLPPLGTLDDIISKSLGLGFILTTLGVVTGASWGLVESPRFWTDPKLATSLATWAACLLLVVLRITAGWRGRKAAVMAVTVVAASAATWAVHYVKH